MNNWEVLQNKVKLETREYFSSKNYNFSELFSLFKRLVVLPVDDCDEVEGVCTRLPRALFDILDDDATKKIRLSRFNELVKIEGYLKKILYFVNRDALNNIINERRGLLALSKALKLKPKTSVYNNPDSLNRSNYDTYDYHFMRIYNLRNDESHAMKEYSEREISEYIESLFIVYLESINKHKISLLTLLEDFEYDFTLYVENIINDFEDCYKRFVIIDSTEDKVMIDNFAVEDFDVEGLDEEDIIVRNGSIVDIVANKLPEKRMILCGEAGMGKTTALKYLAYLGAKKYHAHESSCLPVYLPLGMIIDESVSILEYASNIMGVEYLTFLDLLCAGRILLYLDGVNEIPASLDDNAPQSKFLKSRLVEIQNIIDENRESLVIVSDRPKSNISFNNIPIFRLQKMNDKQIIEFINKNCNIQKHVKIITERVKESPNLKDIISTPLMCARLIEIIDKFNVFPASEGEIIKYFLKSLYKREISEKKDYYFNEIVVENLLIKFAEYGFRKNGGNSGVSRNEILKSFASTISEMSFSYDSVYVLNILLDLGVFISDSTDEVYAFSHQSYQDYYLSIGNLFSSQVVFYRYSSDIDNEENTEDSNDCKNFEDRSDTFVVDNNDFDSSNNNIDIRKTDLYYHMYARNPRYEKSIIFSIQNDSLAVRRQKLKLLLEHNIYLAAKVLSTGEPDNEIEDLIINKALEFAKNSVDYKVISSSVMALIELRKYDDMHEILCYVNNKKMKKIAIWLSGYQCCHYLNAICICYLKGSIKHPNFSAILKIFYDNGYDYFWDETNYGLIEQLSNNILACSLTPVQQARFFVGFNVPNSFLPVNCHYIPNGLKETFSDLKKEFCDKYHLLINNSIEPDIIEDEVDNSDEDNSIFNDFKKIKSFRGFRQTAIPIINSMSDSDKDQLIKISAFESSMRWLRCYLFCLMSIEDRFVITKSYDVWYASRELYRDDDKIFSEEEMHEIFFGDNSTQNNMLSMFSMDCVDPLRYAREHHFSFIDYLYINCEKDKLEKIIQDNDSNKNTHHFSEDIFFYNKKSNMCRFNLSSAYISDIRDYLYKNSFLNDFTDFLYINNEIWK